MVALRGCPQVRASPVQSPVSWPGRLSRVVEFLALLLILAFTPVLASLVPARLSGSTTPRISTPSQPVPCLLSSHLLSNSPPLPPPTTTYDRNNLPLVATDRSGRRQSWSHDQEGRLTSEKDGVGNVVSYDYDLTQATKTSSFLPVRVRYPTYSTELTYL
jgi:YD repeat-containing protein